MVITSYMLAHMEDCLMTTVHLRGCQLAGRKYSTVLEIIHTNTCTL